MPNEIKQKFGGNTAMSITLASLASGQGRQSAVEDNSTSRYQKLLVYVHVKLGTSPLANKSVRLYLIRDDNNGGTHRTDGAGGSDANITRKNAQLIGTMTTGPAPATGDDLYGEFIVHDPGPWWGVILEHDTGVALNATGSNHWIRYIGINPEVQ